MKSSRKENDSPNTTKLSTARKVTVDDINVKGVARSVMKLRNSDYNNPSAVIEINEYHPSPLDFEEFMTWACGQLNVGKSLVFTTVTQEERSVDRITRAGKGKVRSRITPPLLDTTSPQKEDDKESLQLTNEQEVINIEAEYSADRLAHIKFDKNTEIPPKIFKILNLIIDFHPNLSKITINRGLTSTVVYEISNILCVSNLTEIILDHCYIREANFHILLERPNCLKLLSLAMCDIGDKGLEVICEKLVYPLPGSNTLSALYIPCNRITDVGAGYIAKVLRSNRRLTYLNVAGNNLTDKGAGKILSTLTRFLLTPEEHEASQIRYLTFLRKKEYLVNKLFNEMKEMSRTNKKSLYANYKARAVKSIVDKDEKKKVKSYIKNETPDQEYHAYLLERAEIEVEESHGEFKDPFSNKTTILKDRKRFSNGNNHLCYLNLNYNNLSLLTVKKLIRVLEYQRGVSTGLVNVCIEGNPLPVSCPELNTLAFMIEKRFGGRHSRSSQIHKKVKSQASKNIDN